jgi:hypothetical protein
MWWDRPSYEPNVWRRSGLLGYDEYDFDAPPDGIHHVPWPTMELEQEDLLVSVEEYIPPGISEEEATHMALKTTSSSSCPSGRVSACSCTPLQMVMRWCHHHLRMHRLLRRRTRHRWSMAVPWDPLAMVDLTEEDDK